MDPAGSRGEAWPLQSVIARNQEEITLTLTSTNGEPGGVPRLQEDPLPPAVDESAFYETWWFWTIIGGAAAIAVGGTILAVSGGEELPEGGTLGILDARK